MNYIFSTATNDTLFQQFIPTQPGSAAAKGKIRVLIKGGANVADKHFITSQGAATAVTDEELAFLEDHRVFKLGVENGHYKVSKKNIEVSKAVADMAKKDASAPGTPQDNVFKKAFTDMNSFEDAQSKAMA